MALPFLTPIGPSFLLHLLGNFKKKYKPDYSNGFGNSQVSVIIPALNEEKNLPYALYSLSKQTYQTKDIWIVDDGSKDGTAEMALNYKKVTGLNIKVSQREKPMGKTRAIKDICKKTDSKLIFVLDADTVLKDNDYLENLVKIHSDESVASAYGIVKPLRKKNKKDLFKGDLEDILYEIRGEIEWKGDRLNRFTIDAINPGNNSKIDWMMRLPVIMHRQSLYNYTQNFLNKNQMNLFETTMVPVGCGVMYKRNKLVNIFDTFEKKLGDNLTNSEDIFIGFAICNNGYKNVQVDNISMLTTEPKITRLMKQQYLWISSYFQSSYYFKDFLKTPFTFFKEDSKKIGLVNSLTIAEKVAFPGVLGVLGFINPEMVPLTLGLEHVIYTAINFFNAEKGEKLKTLYNSTLSLPVRLSVHANEIFTMGKVGFDILKGNRNWRK